MNRSYPALRGIAILLVIINHTIHMVTQYAREAIPALPQGGWSGVVLSTISGLGFYAVPIFLFLSGCFFAYAAGKNDLRSNYKVVWANLKHVAVPYLIWSLIFYAALFLVHGTALTPMGVARNLLVGYPFNFVPLLMFLYLVSPLLVRLLRRFGWWVIVLIAAYQLLLLAVISPRDAGFQAPGFASLLAPPVLSVPLSEWAIYFPLGLYMVMASARIIPVVHRFRWPLVALVLAFFALAGLSALKYIHIPFSRQLCALPLLLLSTVFQRNAIPYVHKLEILGKRAYGLYLTNLLVLDLTLFAISKTIPGVFEWYVLLMPVMGALALFLPLFVMTVFERRMKPVVFRYAFG